MCNLLGPLDDPQTNKVRKKEYTNEQFSSYVPGLRLTLHIVDLKQYFIVIGHELFVFGIHV